MKGAWLLLAGALLVLCTIRSHADTDLKSAPPFSGKTLGREPLALEAFRGKRVILHFWTPYCFVCPQEMRSLERLKDALEDTDVEILSIISHDVSESAVRAARKMNISIPTIVDTDGTIAAAYGVKMLPVTFIIGRDGRFRSIADPDTPTVSRWRIDGARSWARRAVVDTLTRLDDEAGGTRKGLERKE